MEDSRHLLLQVALCAWGACLPPEE